jgi:hypothetical protein
MGRVVPISKTGDLYINNCDHANCIAPCIEVAMIWFINPLTPIQKNSFPVSRLPLRIFKSLDKPGINTSNAVNSSVGIQ